MSESGYVYTLTDPRTDEVRYVGATKNPSERLRQHLENPHSIDLDQWISELEEACCEPGMNLIGFAEVCSLSEREEQAIERLQDDHDLLNAQEYSAYRGQTTSGSQEQINSTDHELLDLLSDGRHTTGSLAAATGKTTNYIRDRLKLMRLNGWVRYYHEPTALHELVDDPREVDGE